MILIVVAYNIQPHQFRNTDGLRPVAVGELVLKNDAVGVVEEVGEDGVGGKIVDGAKNENGPDDVMLRGLGLLIEGEVVVEAGGVCCVTDGDVKLVDIGGGAGLHPNRGY